MGMGQLFSKMFDHFGYGCRYSGREIFFSACELFDKMHF